MAIQFTGDALTHSYIEITSTEGIDFRRYAENSWEERMGGSWESISPWREDELDEAWADYCACHPNCPIVRQTLGLPL